jgi:alanyl-tRNA synthetase
VCDTVFALNHTAYPELTENADYIRKVIRVEEERFSKTIEQGMDLLAQMMQEIQDTHSGDTAPIIPGEQVFKLYDTFGFPLDLTMEIAADKGFRVDEEGFLTFMHKQRDRARKAREEQGVASWEDDVLAGVSFEDTFIGYESLQTTTEVLAIVRGNEMVSEISEGDEAIIFLAETPFYAESGGQVGDTGIINVGKSIFKVTDCRKSPTGHIMHIGKIISGFIPVGDRAIVVVDQRRRRAIMRNHTAAHLLQAALRTVLGEHVHQAGSYVSDEICRFDFTHFNATTPAQLAEVESKVNDLILGALPVVTAEMPIAEAKKLGAMALFGDKYGDIVRVCKIEDQSVELCGGTHVGNTAGLGLFKITGESSVAAGVRRIEAVTGRGVLALIDRQDAVLENLCAAFKVGAEAELEGRVAATLAQVKTLQREVDTLNQKLLDGSLTSLDENMESLGPVRFLTAVLGETTVDSMKAAADKMKDQHSDIVGVFSGLTGGKGNLLVFAGKDAVKAGIHAGKLVKEISAITGGAGGGRPDNAMGGMGDPAKASEALAAAKAIVSAHLGL